ncbi:RNA polymerase subunit sigma-24 [Nocardioides sp. Soil777]|uniref:RNA polymerase sigma factor n=1 Tax=Nocardioides sp. Soil777 TaxID=1736409 RepID=UPI000702BC10|nr:sigma-70 family RNA polymerase sigma factor [Nocardioides sp. Soil777]KRF00061.1 RNA polymerase subunit sigma-24 [Nocardioides sp. Soil777]
MDEDLLRALVPQVIGVLVRRGNDFATAEDAVQDALVEAVRVWPQAPPANPRAWLVTVAQRRLVDVRRSEAARRRREESDAEEPAPGPVEQADDALLLLTLCCHPSLSPTSAVALTLRAVGGLTTAQVADAFLVPQATMAQRISRAKATIRDVPLDRPGDLAAVLRVLYLVFHTGHRGQVDLAAEAIRLTRQLTLASPEPEVRGLLALMLLHHARDAARWDEGRLVPLDRQDRSRWDAAQVAEGVAILQESLRHGEPGEYRMQAAIAALHDDAASWEETDWHQVLGWYDDLVALAGNPIARLSRLVALGHVEGPEAALAELAGLDAESGDTAQHHAVRGYLLELAGDRDAAATAYARAAGLATSAPERDHLTRSAAALRS